jgi:hypothetical protein
MERVRKERKKDGLEVYWFFRDHVFEHQSGIGVLGKD